MATLPLQAAAYTRTGILLRFLDQLAQADPGRVDREYAEKRLQLKGGDVRAFLQTLRVLGITDAYGRTTDQARRMRGTAGRPVALRQGLEAAYPDLLRRWERQGGMARTTVEEFFRVEYGLSASTAGPAAKLFTDLMRELDGAAEGEPPAAPPPPAAPRSRTVGVGAQRRTQSPTNDVESSGTVECQVDGGEESGDSRQSVGIPDLSRHDPPGGVRAVPAAGPRPRELVGSPGAERRAGQDRSAEVQVAALEMVRGVLQVQVDGQWDADRIDLLFDRLERLVDRILGSPAGR